MNRLGKRSTMTQIKYFLVGVKRKPLTKSKVSLSYFHCGILKGCNIRAGTLKTKIHNQLPLALGWATNTTPEDHDTFYYRRDA